MPPFELCCFHLFHIESGLFSFLSQARICPQPVSIKPLTYISIIAVTTYFLHPGHNCYFWRFSKLPALGNDGDVCTGVEKLASPKICATLFQQLLNNKQSWEGPNPLERSLEHFIQLVLFISSLKSPNSSF